MASPRTTPSGERATSAGEIRGLTGLRIVAAAWVVVFHFHFTPLPGVAEVVGVMGPLITSGALGVDLFFVLSGFVIAHTYLDRLGPALRVGATARFGWARAGRIWPVYLVVFHLFGAWLLARALLGADGEIAFQAVQPVLSVGEWLQQLFMIQLWDQPFFDGASWVGATWSISAEWLAYLLFPIAALGFYRLRGLPAAVLVLAALALMAPMAAAYLTAGHPYYPWSWLVRILCGFAAGVFMLMAVRRMRWTSRVRRGASVLAAVIPVVIAAGLLLGELAGPGRGGAVIVLFPLLVAAIAVADRGPVTLLWGRAANYGGRLSYSLYLIHIPVFEVFWLALRRFEWLRPDSVLTHAVALAVLLSTPLVAAVAFRLVEEPSRRGMRRMAQKREPVVAVQRVDLVASFRAARELGPRHAAVAGRQPKLAAALVQAQRRRPVRGADLLADLERAGILRNGYLHTP
ncbi:acyltransferase [Actinomycetes bacterium KLBMP 9759]